MAHEDQWDSRFEEAVGGAFSAVGESIRPETGPRLDEIAEQGRSLRRRRMAGIAGSVVALAAIGVGGVFVSGLGNPGRTGSTMAAAPVVTAKPSEAAKTVAPLTYQEIADNLQKLLGPQATLDPPGRGEGAGGQFYVAGVSDDGHGKAAFALDLDLRPAGPARPEELICPTPYDDCSITKPEDGWTLVLVKGYEYPDKRVLTKSWRASLVGPDGQRLYFANWNSPDQKGAPMSRTDPPMDFQQLTSLVTDPSWKPMFDRMPKPKPLPPTPEAQPDGDEILRVAAGLLPNGLTEMDAYGQKGIASFNVDDGKGKAMVQIFVGKDPAGVPDSRYDKAETLPDGSRLVVQQTNSTDVRWQADVLHPDGTRVQVAASNIVMQKKTDPLRPPTRSTPPLTLDQLKAIAENPIWQQHNGKQQQ